MPYRSEILLKELWSDHCCLDVIFDLGLSRKAWQGGRQSPLDMLGYNWSERDIDLAHFDVLERIRGICTIIVEGKLLLG